MIMNQAELVEACANMPAEICKLTFMMLPNLYPGVLAPQLWRLFVAWTPQLQVW
jgi:hypothetical protein